MQSKPLIWVWWEETTDIILPEHLLSSWQGINSPSDPDAACDYDRANAITEPIATIPVGTGHGIVISNAPMLCWVPMQDGGYLVVVRTWTDINDEVALRVVESIPQDQYGDPCFIYDLPDPKLYVLGCSDTFGNIFGRGHVVLELTTPGRYRISSAERRLTDTETFMVHRFQKL